ncbi:MAG: YfhO family protein [Clostridiales bacterium]|nr:YfhO family protein [Clostridiales bacterium]
MFIAYAVFGIYPFGDDSVLILDLNGQYVYYYEMLRDAFWGERSLIYSWSRNLSGEMFGVYAYYLASPFMIIICILPRALMLTSVMIMQLAKIGASAVTFMFFLKKRGTKKTTSLIMFPILYALMSYMVVQLMDPMWLDGLVYLPLIMWGVHRLVDEQKVLPFIIPLALMFVAHFYIGYMIGFFTFLYFIYACLSKEGRVLPKNFIVVCFKFCAGTIVAIMCAAYVIIPVYNSLQLGKLEFSVPDFTIRTQFTFVQFISKMFPLSYDTVYPSGLPMVFCGTLTLILIPLFFLNSKISVKEKVSKGVLALGLVLCMWISPVDMAWHGFQVPNWSPYRYSFVVSAIFILMAVSAFENLDGIKGKDLGATIFGLFILVVYYENEGLENLKAFRTIVNDGKEKVIPQGLLVAMIALVLYYITLHVIRTKNKRVTAIASTLLVAFVCIEMFANSLDTLEKNDKGINSELDGYTGLSYSTYEGYTPYMKELRSVVKQVEESDNSFYRMESMFHRTVNDPIGVGYAGLTHSSSTMNAPALTMLKKLGYAYGGHYTSYKGTTEITDAIFNIKYLLERDDDDHRSQYFVPASYNLKYTSTETLSNINVYENPNALSVGIVGSKRVNELVLDDFDPFTNQNNLMNYLLDTNSNMSYFDRIYPESTDRENLSTAGVSEGHTKYYYENEENSECHIDYNFTMYGNGPMYMFLPTEYERKVNVWVASSLTEDVPEDSENFNFVGSFFTGGDYSILRLGNFSDGESIRVRISILQDEYLAYWKDEIFCTINQENFQNAIAELKTRTWNITEHTDTYLEGTVQAEEDQVLFTTIPYEPGWTIKVDGKEVTPEKSMDSLITIPLTAGEHTVTMKFWPNYLTQGIIVSCCGLLALALVFVFEYKNGKIIDKIINKEKSQASTK